MKKITKSKIKIKIKISQSFIPSCFPFFLIENETTQGVIMSSPNNILESRGNAWALFSLHAFTIFQLLGLLLLHAKSTKIPYSYLLTSPNSCVYFLVPIEGERKQILLVPKTSWQLACELLRAKNVIILFSFV